MEKDEVREVFDYWRQFAHLSQMKALTKGLSADIEQALILWGQENVKDAIDAYAMILANPTVFWFSQRYSLRDFVRNIQMFVPLNRPLDRYRRMGGSMGECKYKDWPGPLYHNINVSELEQCGCPRCLEMITEKGKGGKYGREIDSLN